MGVTWELQHCFSDRFYMSCFPHQTTSPQSDVMSWMSPIHQCPSQTSSGRAELCLPISGCPLGWAPPLTRGAPQKTLLDKLPHSPLPQPQPPSPVLKTPLEKEEDRILEKLSGGPESISQVAVAGREPRAPARALVVGGMEATAPQTPQGPLGLVF